MRKYLATLHKRSDDHKRRFAFLTSGSITLIIFAFWGVANFGAPGLATAENEDKKVKEVSPFESIVSSANDGWEGIKDSFLEIKEEFEGRQEFMKGYDGNGGL